MTPNEFPPEQPLHSGQPVERDPVTSDMAATTQPWATDAPRGLVSQDGRPLDELGPDDSVVVEGSKYGVALPAGAVLTEDRQPLAEAADGLVTTLGGGQVVKLGGDLLKVYPTDNDNK